MLSIIASAVISLAAPPNSNARDFAVDGRTFSATNNRTCIIEGEWSDGAHFRYQAWDECKALTFERIKPKPADEIIEQVHGVDQTFLIPAGSESFVIGNERSLIQLFRNKQGEVQEIVLAD